MPVTLIVGQLDTLAGERLTDVHLTAQKVTRLGCGCTRYRCARPGGGHVDVTVGAHCQQVHPDLPDARVVAS